MIKGKDRGRSAWYYVLLFDDEETIKLLRRNCRRISLI